MTSFTDKQNNFRMNITSMEEIIAVNKTEEEVKDSSQLLENKTSIENLKQNDQEVKAELFFD